MTVQNTNNSNPAPRIPLFRTYEQPPGLPQREFGRRPVSVVRLTTEELSVIVGALLGDAHLQKRNGSYRLKITQAATQREYLTWKYRKLQRLCTTTQAPTSAVDRKGNESVTFYTSSGLWLAPIHSLYYELAESKYVKKITQALIDSLPMDPMVLAIWFMDDGSIRNDCYAGKLATQGFTREESELLCQYLNKWGIVGNVVYHTVSSGQYYISIPASSFGRLIEIIEPLDGRGRPSRPIVREIPTMVYKLNDLNRTP
uniref:Putative LAGLIDADG homing endonuclease n=1 Tax=Stephanosphaera pluvialis TaxID=51712 RepID=A0A0S2IDR9_9CHLO|nr:putative LAGLIDADG homing endonuclease [Stephanosphaera pluvialis]